MSNNPAKDFGEIATEYTFFEEHSTEAQEDVRAYQEHVAAVTPLDGIVNMLDFGCGSGTFTERFLEQAGWSPKQLRLTLVEPVESARGKAVARLGRFADSPLAESSALPNAFDQGFDVVLANHVFYYVPDLRDTLRRLIAALAPTGVFLMAIAPRTNAMCEFGERCFKLMGREMPYNTSEDIEAALQSLNAAYDKQHVPYQLSFADSRESRMQILRFLLADHLTRLPGHQLLDWFDQYSVAGRVEIHTETDHYTLRP